MTSVLVVDDEKALLEQTIDYLHFEGFETFSASTGLEGLQVAREQLPDIILCDINMPELSGFEVLEELQRDSVTSTIPFIFLTARSDSTDRRSGMNLGADDYITKPFQNSDLVAAIRSRLNKKSAFERDRIYSFLYRLISFQENERHNLSEHLQDHFLASFMGIQTMLKILQLQFPDSEEQIFDQALKMINQAIQELNDLSLMLAPAMLDQLGLIPALRWLFNQFTNRTQIKVNFQHDKLSNAFETEQKIMLYRIIQEGITNVEKHAKIGEVFVRLWIEDNFLHLQIYDEGMGFNVAETLNGPDSLGLLSMQARASILSSEITFMSAPKEGTQIIAQFPLEQERPSHSMSAFGPKLVQNLVDDTANEQATPLVIHDSMANGLRVLIVEPNDLIRWGIRKSLEMDARFAVIAEASTAKQTNNLIEDLDFDILILSMSLSDSNSLELVEQIHNEYENLAILMLSNHAEAAYAMEALARGASGYITKMADSKELSQALLTIAAGELWVSRDIQDMQDTTDSKVPLDTLSSLTRRELEIFYLVVEGNSNKEIADMLFVSPRTAETHRLNMMRKLGMKGQASLMRYAIKKGIIDPPK